MASQFNLIVGRHRKVVAVSTLQERIRAMHRELLLQSCGVFESQRVCEFLVLGLASKNNRTRIEVIEVHLHRALTLSEF